MRRSTSHRLLTGILTLLLTAGTAAGALAQEKEPLDHSVYDDWMLIEDRALSPDGAWLLYRMEPQDEGDGTLV
ncbi:MAG: hypothetical protein R6W82_06995, partial [bacterium]